ncbi:TPA_asm: nucleocapsid protein [Silene virus 1]|uniref:Nucleoprotein n=1 Tax=Silene virus 1 TaxID=2977989 RepID=A0A9N6YJF3_9RHAB|nr:TPA_asm: nucleocapsid protein [Silene virus 1]
MGDVGKRKNIMDIRNEMKRKMLEQSDDAEDEMIHESHVNESIGFEYETYMKNIATMPVTPLADNEAFAAMDKAQTVLASIHDWTDLQPGARPAYHLKHANLVTDLTTFYTLALSTFEEFFTNLSAQTVAKLLLLAYNLRTEDGELVFAPIDARLVATADERDIEDLSGSTLQNAFTSMPIRFAPIAGEGRNDYMLKVVTSLSFMACSIIRVVTRSAANYCAAKNAIHKGMSYFFSYNSYADGYPVTEQMMVAVKTCLTNNPIVKHTLYTFFHAGENTKVGDNMKDFLYRIHTQYTGFHIYNLFTRGADVYHVSMRKFATYLDTTLFRQTLDMLAELFSKCAANQDAEHKLRMWRFARIFEPKFFVELQTRRCVHFVAVLAFMNKIQDPEVDKRSGDVLQIAQIVDMPRAAKEFACIYAIRAHYILTDIQLDGNYMNLLSQAYRRN